MVDVRTSCQFSDSISEDIDESINMGPSIDRVSIQVWAVITIDCDMGWCVCALLLLRSTLSRPRVTHATIFPILVAYQTMFLMFN